MQFYAIPIPIEPGAGVPYSIRKARCKQTDGDRGGYVLSYTDSKGKGHRNCHTSRKKAKGQIAAIEMPEAIEESWVPLAVRITHLLEEQLSELAGSFEANESSGDTGLEVGDRVRPRHVSSEMMIHTSGKVPKGKVIADNNDGTYDIEWEPPPMPGNIDDPEMDDWEPEERVERRVSGSTLKRAKI